MKNERAIPLARLAAVLMGINLTAAAGLFLTDPEDRGDLPLILALLVVVVVYEGAMIIPTALAATSAAAWGWRRLPPATLGSLVTLTSMAASASVMWVFVGAVEGLMWWTWVAVAALSGLAVWRLRRRWEPAGSERR